MKTIYIDSNYICHVENDGTRIQIETNQFDDLCDKAIELIRFVPIGYSWIKLNGEIIYGEFIQAIDTELIDKYQYESSKEYKELIDMKNAFQILEV